MSLIVSPLNGVDRLCRERQPSHVLTLLSPGSAVPKVDAADAARFVVLAHDITEPTEGLVAPQASQVIAMLEFARRWNPLRPMLVHCWAGVSRSTAAAFAIACDKRPDVDETAIAAALRLASPCATPNPLIVALADRLLGRGGRMTAAVQAIGRGADFTPSCYFELTLEAL